MDWRPGTRDGQPAVEWTWEGTDGADVTDMTGRGWAKLEDDDLHGMIVIHLGDESDFVAKRAKTQRRPRRKQRRDWRTATRPLPGSSQTVARRDTPPAPSRADTG